MRRVTFAILFSLLALNVTGCGGCSSGTSEAEMRRRAASIKRAPEYDEEQPPPPAAPSIAADGAVPAAESDDDPPAVPAVTAASPLEPAASAPVPPAPAAVPAPTSVSVTETQPTPTAPTPLTAEAALVRSVANLEKIAEAMQQYMTQKGQGNLPAPAIVEPESRQPLLSWRVELLPLLGHEELYKQFRRNESWNSAHNRKLLEKIPPEYQSPERFDTRTNYQVVMGPLAAFVPRGGQSPRLFEAGASNVIMLVEVDDALATPWTKPQEYSLDPKAPLQGLGGLRQDGFLAILSDGLVCKVPAATPPETVRNLFAIEPKTVIAGTIVTDPLETRPTAVTTAATAAPTTIPTAHASNTAAQPAAARASAMPASAAVRPTSTSEVLASLLPGVNRPPRDPIPADDDLKRARTLIGEMYRQEYTAARYPAAKKDLAERMLRDSENVSANAADYYELVRIARDVAVSAGALELAQQAVDRLDERFEIDGLQQRTKTLEDVNRVANDQVTSDAIARSARELMQQAIEQDDFESARTACDLYLASMRKLQHRAGQKEATELRQAIDRLQHAYSDVPAAIRTLQQDPSDHHASQTVGQYFCFAKGQWDLGLPLLAKAADVKLRGLAMVDLDSSKSPAAMLQLADEYLQMAREQKPPLDRGMKLRAAHYFAQAASAMPPGLERIKAQKRLDELRDLFGRTWLDETLGLAPTAAISDEDDD